jgi:hypothetical protein
MCIEVSSTKVTVSPNMAFILSKALVITARKHLPQFGDETNVRRYCLHNFCRIRAMLASVCVWPANTNRQNRIAHAL